MGISERIKLENLRRRWQDIFSEPMSMHTAPSDIKQGVLVIAVDSPTWLQHLKFMKKEIIGKLASHGITDVRFRHGNIKEVEQGKPFDNATPPEDFRELTSEDHYLIERTVEGVEDDELKDALKSIMEKAARRKK
jgi:hypothetical protein